MRTSPVRIIYTDNISSDNGYGSWFASPKYHPTLRNTSKTKWCTLVNVLYIRYGRVSFSSPNRTKSTRLCFTQLTQSTISGWRLSTVYWSRLWPADGTWYRRTPGSWSFGEHGLLLAPEISLSPALSSGTRYLRICESRHCLRRRLPDTWKLACFVARVSASEDSLVCAI